MTSIWKQEMTSYPDDGVHTETSRTQSSTESKLCNLMTTSPPCPPKTLNRSAHASFLGQHLISLPSPYISLDASRPWLTYWALHGFDLLGIGLDDEMKSRAISTVLSFQHPQLGGFCGGPPPGHQPHLLPTYASIMSLAILCGDHSKRGGGMSELGRKAWGKVDREAVYGFFMRCKRDDGGFVVCEGGEVDVRGIYCLLVCATLLDILTPELIKGTSTFLKNCQTYEGGFASASFPSSNPTICPASAEAHGGYTSCAVFSWFLLQPLIDPDRHPSERFRSDSDVDAVSTSPPTSPSIDIDAVLRWGVMQQGYAVEAGGFRGRTNKLVDGCYGWWVGGLFAVLESVVGGGAAGDDEGDDEGDEDAADAADADAIPGQHKENFILGDNGAWEEVTTNQDMLFNRTALQEYILIAAQSEKGGLRDKPGKSPDLYHTANNLSGLSSAQHLVRHLPDQVKKLESEWKPSSAPKWLLERTGETQEQSDSRRRAIWANARGWVEDDSSYLAVGGDANRVNTTSPVFNVLLMRVRPMVDYFYGQEGST